jgi:hypothetical protein
MGAFQLEICIQKVERGIVTHPDKEKGQETEHHSSSQSCMQSSPVCCAHEVLHKRCLRYRVQKQLSRLRGVSPMIFFFEEKGRRRPVRSTSSFVVGGQVAVVRAFGMIVYG